MVETERAAGAAYLTCNERHHELILIEDPVRRGYDHIGLEVADAAALEAAKRSVPAAGGRVLGGVYDGEPGIDRALRVQGPGGHVFKLFCGMETVDQRLEPGDRPDQVRARLRQDAAARPARALPPATASASASATAWGRSPAGGTATPTTTAWPSSWPRAASSPTTPTRSTTSTRWAASPTASSTSATRG